VTALPGVGRVSNRQRRNGNDQTDNNAPEHEPSLEERCASKMMCVAAGIKPHFVHIRAFTADEGNLRLLLHILDAGECDALGPFAGVAEVKFILGQKHRIAVDVVGDAGAVGGNERVELLAVVG
jgi:hypothetical protein